MCNNNELMPIPLHLSSNSSLSSTSKVWGIGLGRTCTHSLNAALNQLGYHTCHQPDLLSSVSTLEETLLYYDGATDSQVALFYKELHNKWPDSKFILTVRNKTSWLQSCSNHFKNISIRNKKLRMLLYGVETFDEEIFAAAALHHFSDVLSFFSGCKEMRSKLLIMDIQSGRDGWFQLCLFLNVPVPLHEQLNAFPNIQSESQHRQACEFANRSFKIGMLWICKFNSVNSRKIWIRRRCLLRNNGDFYIYPLRCKSLHLWEDLYNVRFASLLPVKGPRSDSTHPSVGTCITVTNVNRLMKKKKMKNELVLGFDSSSNMKEWIERFLQVCTQT